MDAITPGEGGANPVRRGAILCGLGLIVLYPFFSVPIQASIPRLAPATGVIAARVLTEAAVWLYAALVLLLAVRWEGRTLASIGLRRPKLASVGFGVVGLVAMSAAGALAASLVYLVLRQPQHANAQAAALVGGSVVYAGCLAVRAGVIEEILFRGLAVEQLSVLTGSRGLAAFLATALFVVVHALHFDWVQLVPIAALGVVLVALYLWRHDLWANIFAHVAVDAAGLVAVTMQAHKLTH